MKNFKIYAYVLFAGLLGLSACKPSIVQPSTFSAGPLDLTRYISVGNSLTAGYADGGLYLEGQQNSYPSIIAQQLQQVGGGSFTQPLFDPSQANGTGYQSLTGFDATGSPILTAVPANAVTGSATIPGFGTVPIFAKYTGNFDNYGVPGIKLANVNVAAYGNVNPYFARMLPGATGTLNTTYLSFVTASPYSFFTDWLGNNDALLYATSGGAGDTLTTKAVFTSTYNATVAKLIANGAKGALASIPDVTTIPYFNTVTYAALLAGVQKSAPTVTGLYINALVSPLPAAATYAARLATPSDLFVLTFPTALLGSTTAGVGTYPYGLDPRNPIQTQYVLDANEVANVKDYVNSYNGTIRSAAAANRLAYFDAFTFLNGVKSNGLLVNGASLNSGYISGGIFSLDGVHLTPRGYAIVANEFIKAINSNYNSNIPLADVSSYRGVKFP